MRVNYLDGRKDVQEKGRTQAPAPDLALTQILGHEKRTERRKIPTDSEEEGSSNVRDVMQ